MGRRKKPGAPGKTTIPPEIVTSVTQRLASTFKKHGYHRDHHLFIVPQQCYLYVEVERKPLFKRVPSLPITLSSTTHIPLGRLRYLGSAEEWEHQPYRWSDECWVEEEMERGTPEGLMLSMVVEHLC